MSMSGGSTVRQMSITTGHRVWNLQPAGGFAGLGMSPGRMTRWRRVCGSMEGIAAINACV